MINQDWQQGFEKTAFIGGGLIKSIGKGIWGLGKRLVTNVGKNGTRTFSPMKTIGTAFGVSEAGSVISKMNQNRQAIKGVGTTGLKGMGSYGLRY